MVENKDANQMKLELEEALQAIQVYRAMVADLHTHKVRAATLEKELEEAREELNQLKSSFVLLSKFQKLEDSLSNLPRLIGRLEAYLDKTGH